jgi:hypothetical protein
LQRLELFKRNSNVAGVYVAIRDEPCEHVFGRRGSKRQASLPWSWKKREEEAPVQDSLIQTVAVLPILSLSSQDNV